MLGGHAYRPIKPYTADIGHRERESRQLRLLFWLCYIFDKDISLRMNQPPLMSEEYCDMTLPEGYVNSYLFLPDMDPSLATRLDFDKNPFPLFPGELRLSQFKAKTTRLLYSAQAVNKTEAELFQNIRELDDELERWRLSIIPEYRPSLSISEMAEETIAQTRPGAMKGMRRIVLHLEVSPQTPLCRDTRLIAHKPAVPSFNDNDTPCKRSLLHGCCASQQGEPGPYRGGVVQHRADHRGQPLYSRFPQDCNAQS
jgi:hypothetical protein